jgi:hypothetical protein
MEYLLDNSLTNIQDFNPALMNHNQEEADTSIVLHAIDVSQSNPFRDVIISCSDTDVLLINYYNELCINTIFRTREHDMPLRLASEKLGNEKCKANWDFMDQPVVIKLENSTAFLSWLAGKHFSLLQQMY